MSHGPFQEPFTGQKPFSKHPAVAHDGPGLAISTVTRDGAGGREIAAVGKAVLELALPDRLDGSKCAD